MCLQVIQNRIFEVRGYRVMIDFHLAELYQVETRALKQAVKRNLERFPAEDFMFSLTKEEAEMVLAIGVSQNAIPPPTTTSEQPPRWHFRRLVSPCCPQFSNHK